MSVNVMNEPAPAAPAESRGDYLMSLYEKQQEIVKSYPSKYELQFAYDRVYGFRRRYWSKKNGPFFKSDIKMPEDEFRAKLDKLVARLDLVLEADRKEDEAREARRIAVEAKEAEWVALIRVAYGAAPDVKVSPLVLRPQAIRNAVNNRSVYELASFPNMMGKNLPEDLKERAEAIVSLDRALAGALESVGLL